MSVSKRISTSLQLPENAIQVVLDLLSEGATVPFIARYRKDKTGGLDEVEILNIQAQHKELVAFDERQAFIIKTIEEQGKMTEELLAKIQSAENIAVLEDIYLPYKPKRRTKAQIARENGLEPLAAIIRDEQDEDFETLAAQYINEQVKDVAAAIQGAREIIAEEINENADIRASLRNFFEQEAKLIATVVEDKKEEGAKYKDYFEYSESIKTIPSHRTLAIMRGFMEGVLRMSIEPDMEVAIGKIESTIITKSNASTPILQKAVKDAYRRLLQPSLETEFRQLLKTQADEEAIQVFADNLKQLLLSSPLGGKRLIAIDPGYRTGCKVVVIDEKGDLLVNDLIYVHEQNDKLIKARNTIESLVKQYDVEAFAIGDGTAGRETEAFIKSLKTGLPVFLVNEDGASIYSASEVAREEFPEYDITVRGAVSIGRRLMDPLAELVKIDPKSIGVGQYQHDVNQVRLKEKLDQTVVSCVNAVGVNLNTAGKHLLSYVSGIGPSLAENIVLYRKTNGQFTSRKELLKVPRLGAKVYEQCAGFLKVVNGAEVLDNSTVHPESYGVVAKIAQDHQVDVASLIGNTALLDKVNVQQYVTEEIGVLTIKDIIKELKKPGLDPRAEAQAFEFADIYKLEEVQVGMIVPGIVTNITKFGAFVDIGVKQDGLVHVSEIAHKYITDPAEVLKLNQQVQVKVMEVDIARSRIALSIKQATPNTGERQERAPKTKPAKNTNSASNTKQDWQSSLANLKSKFGK